MRGEAQAHAAPARHERGGHAARHDGAAGEAGGQARLLDALEACALGRHLDVAHGPGLEVASAALTLATSTVVAPAQAADEAHTRHGDHRAPVCLDRPAVAEPCPRE